jgi:ketosteroid isomerase-like protein
MSLTEGSDEKEDAMAQRGDAPGVLERLIEATNDHDLERLADCFAADFVNETPAHPDRSFVGREQVRKNWARIFDAVPDIHATLVRWSQDDETVWAEWDHRGTRRDGRPHEMAGATVMGVRDGRIEWTRFYLEPVMRDGLDVGSAIERAMTGGGSR